VQAPRALGGVFGTSKFPPAAVEPLYTEPVRPIDGSRRDEPRNRLPSA
jgi:hypothetical protein